MAFRFDLSARIFVSWLCEPSTNFPNLFSNISLIGLSSSFGQNTRRTQLARATDQIAKFVIRCLLGEDGLGAAAVAC
jgi:hypothetical protein